MIKFFKYFVLIIAVFFIVFLVLFVKEYNEREELIEKKQENIAALTRSQKIKRESKNLEDELSRIHEKMLQIERKIPQEDKGPFDFIKSISYVASKYNLRNMEFEYKGQADAKIKLGDSKKSIKKADDYAKNDKAALSNIENAFQQSSRDVKKKKLSQKVKKHLIEMTFEAQFEQIIGFLHDLLSMDRIVIIEKMEIERAENILPRQTVILNIAIYNIIG